jgi:hypothetical protein
MISHFRICKVVGTSPLSKLSLQSLLLAVFLPVVAVSVRDGPCAGGVFRLRGGGGGLEQDPIPNTHRSTGSPMSGLVNGAWPMHKRMKLQVSTVI